MISYILYINVLCSTWRLIVKNKESATFFSTKPLQYDTDAEIRLMLRGKLIKNDNDLNQTHANTNACVSINSWSRLFA